MVWWHPCAMSLGKICDRENAFSAGHAASFRKVNVRLPGRENSKSYGARPVHLIITMSKWFLNSRLSRKKELSLYAGSHASRLSRAILFEKSFNFKKIWR